MMGIPELKLYVLEQIMQMEDEKSLIDVFNVINKQDDWWDQISDGAKKSIEEGLKDIEEGRTHTHQEARKIINEKYGFEK